MPQHWPIPIHSSYSVISCWIKVLLYLMSHLLLKLFYANVKRMNESKFTLIYIGLKKINTGPVLNSRKSRNAPVTGVSLIQHISVSVTANTGQATASLVCDVQQENTQLCQRKPSRWQVLVRMLKWDKWTEVLLHLHQCAGCRILKARKLQVIGFRETKLIH